MVRALISEPDMETRYSCSQTPKPGNRQPYEPFLCFLGKREIPPFHRYPHIDARAAGSRNSRCTHLQGKSLFAYPVLKLPRSNELTYPAQPLQATIGSAYPVHLLQGSVKQAYPVQVLQGKRRGTLAEAATGPPLRPLDLLPPGFSCQPGHRAS